MQRRTTIVSISDDPRSVGMLARMLTTSQYRIFSSLPGTSALRMCLSLQPELIFIAHDLPGCDARAIAPSIRLLTQTPVIVLSACATDIELVAFLSLGANDYLGRPFTKEVLMARTEAALRSRAVQVAGSPELRNGSLRLDLVKHAVFVGNHAVSFTPKEFDLLRYFLMNRGKMLKHRDILRAVWGPAHCDDSAYLRVFIRQIRRKIESCGTLSSMIKAECGVGYRMDIIDNEGREIEACEQIIATDLLRSTWGHSGAASQSEINCVS